MKADLKITGCVESLHLEPGDRLIVTVETPRLITEQIAESLKQQLHEAFPDHEAIILSPGLRIAKETASVEPEAAA